MIDWHDAGNSMSFAKIGTYGPPGAGKTFTTSKVAVGLLAAIGKKEAYMVDTETGSSFVSPMFEKAGFRLKVIHSAAFADVKAAMIELAKSETVLIIDSVSHVWTELMESYCRKYEKRRLTFPDWRVLKSQWQELNNLFLNGRFHAFVLGRLQDVYEMTEVGEDRGKKDYDIVKVDERMKAEKYFGYEPSLLFRMSAVKDPELEAQLHKARGAKERQVIADKLARLSTYSHIAEVQKDRANLLNGKQFVNPGYEEFLPHFEFLGIGSGKRTKEHIGIDTSRTSDNLFPEEEGTDSSLGQRRTVAAEEIKGTLVKYFPGQSAREKQAKQNVIARLFGTNSWTRIEKGGAKSISVEKLEEAYAGGKDNAPSRTEQECIKEKEIIDSEMFNDG